MAGYLGHTSDDVVLSVLPISFDAGLSQLTTSFIAGAHVVLMNYVLPREVVRLCAEHQVTALCCVPTLLATLERVCGWTENPDAVRGALDDLSWALLNGTLRAAPRQALERAASLARRHGGSLDTGHRRVLRAIEDHAATECSVSVAGSDGQPVA